jgi:hypothetical protein
MREFAWKRVHLPPGHKKQGPSPQEVCRPKHAKSPTASVPRFFAPSGWHGCLLWAFEGDLEIGHHVCYALLADR